MSYNFVTLGYLLTAFLIGPASAVLTVRADIKRRGRPVEESDHFTRMLRLLDLAAPALFVFLAVVSFTGCFFISAGPTGQGTAEANLAAGLAALLTASIAWMRGQKALFEARPPGEVVALVILVSGLCDTLLSLVSRQHFFTGPAEVLLGAVLSQLFRRRFRKKRGEHRILQHVASQGDVLQPEYHRPTPECPEPERWRMYDSMTAEYEVLAFLQQLVETVKPKMIVETGTFMGISTLKLAEGLKANGVGKVITCEYDPVVYAKAVERIDASGLKEWIDARNESSLEMHIEGQVDLLFSDSDPGLREAEVRRYLPLLRNNGIILIHDASSHLKTVREAALKLEREGLISIVLLPTPRGLVLAQKREGRTQ